jgi:uracil-DNA glycosylase
LHPRTDYGLLRNFGLDHMQRIELTLVIGDYAQRWHLPDAESKSVTDTVAAWRTQWPAVLPMPHPSPRNNIWLKINPWFVAEVVPALHGRIAALLSR